MWNEISTRKYKGKYKVDFAFGDAFLDNQGLAGVQVRSKYMIQLKWLHGTQR